MSDFQLDPHLDADTHDVCDLELCAVRLFDDSRYPWLVLIPRRADCIELIDLSDANQMRAMREIAMASGALKALTSPHKLNVAALGNHVRQLHIHVIARQTTDPAWPNPVWGVGERTAYSGKARDQTITALTAALHGQQA